jgi:hypothetical protein
MLPQGWLSALWSCGCQRLLLICQSRSYCPWLRVELDRLTVRLLCFRLQPLQEMVYPLGGFHPCGRFPVEAFGFGNTAPLNLASGKAREGRHNETAVFLCEGELISLFSHVSCLLRRIFPMRGPPDSVLDWYA